MNDPRDVVAAKRDGRTLDPDELRSFVLGYARGEIPDYQAAALLMAAFINGLDASETLALTRAMVDSGVTLPLASRITSVIDRHQFYSVRIENGQAVPAFKASGDITSMSQADGYIEIPAAVEALEAGTVVQVTLF